MTAEITYELILQYLTKEKHIFITDKNTLNYFSDKFKLIFSNNFYRFGVFIYENKDLSFWTSLLTLVDDNFKLIDNDDISIISDYKNKLIDSYSKKISPFLKKFEKNDFREYFKLNPDIIIIQYIVDILNINFIIFDFKIEEIFSVYKNNIMDPFNKTILLAKYDNFWEPIMTSDKKIFTYTDEIIINILKNNIKYYEFDKINKEFKYSLNSKEEIKITSLNKQNKKVENNNVISKSKLERMKNEDLIKILEKNNIKYKTEKKILKIDLITLLINNNLV